MIDELSAADRSSLAAERGPVNMAVGGLMVFDGEPPAWAMGSVRAFNLVVSNIPGPQQPFYLSGIRMHEIYPVVPLNPASQGLAVGIISYDGQVCFGVLADRDLEPPLTMAAAGLLASLAELPSAVH